MLRLGGSAIQWSALQSKQIAASALTPPVSFKADAQGYTRLTDTYDLPYQNIGLIVRKNEVERRADIWLRLLRAVRRGINAWYENPQLAKSVVAKYTRDNDPVTLEKTYEFFTKQAGFNRDLTFSDRGFEQILKFLGGTVLPAAKDAPAKSVLRYKNHREAEKMIFGESQRYKASYGRSRLQMSSAISA